MAIWKPRMSLSVLAVAVSAGCGTLPGALPAPVLPAPGAAARPGVDYTQGELALGNEPSSLDLGGTGGLVSIPRTSLSLDFRPDEFRPTFGRSGWQGGYHGWAPGFDRDVFEHSRFYRRGSWYFPYVDVDGAYRPLSFQFAGQSEYMYEALCAEGASYIPVYLANSQLLTPQAGDFPVAYENSYVSPLTLDQVPAPLSWPGILQQPPQSCCLPPPPTPCCAEAPPPPPPPPPCCAEAPPPPPCCLEPPPPPPPVCCSEEPAIAYPEPEIVPAPEPWHDNGRHEGWYKHHPGHGHGHGHGHGEDDD